MASEFEVKTIVGDVLAKRFVNSGLLNSNIEFAEDFDGEKIIRVTILFSSQSVESQALFDAADEMRERLLRSGDDRFVFVRRDDPGSNEDGRGDEETRKRRAS